jgi:hypothetical protein
MVTEELTINIQPGQISRLTPSESGPLSFLYLSSCQPLILLLQVYILQSSSFSSFHDFTYTPSRVIVPVHFER